MFTGEPAQKAMKVLLLQSVQLFGLQLSLAFGGGRSAPLLGHQVRGHGVGELRVLALHWGRP